MCKSLCLKEIVVLKIGRPSQQQECVLMAAKQCSEASLKGLPAVQVASLENFYLPHLESGSCDLVRAVCFSCGLLGRPLRCLRTEHSA